MLKRFVPAFAIVALVSKVSILPFCGLIFQCGCDFSHGVERCNINSVGGPHCPWCSHGATGFYLPYLAALLLAGLTLLLVLRYVRNSFWTGLLAGLIGFFLWAGLAGLASALLDAYPTFLGYSLF